MPEKPGQAVRTFWLAVLLVMEMAGGYAAGKSVQAPSEGLADAQAGRIQTALCKTDLNFKPTTDSSFAFDSGDLRIAIKADRPTYYEGKSFKNSAPQSGVYGDVNVSEKFYGIEGSALRTFKGKRSIWSGASSRANHRTLRESAAQAASASCL